MFKRISNSVSDDGRYLDASDYQQVTAEDWAMYRIEMTRRTLMELNAKVELGTEYGRRLSEILERAIDEIEELAEEAHEGTRHD